MAPGAEKGKKASPSTEQHNPIVAAEAGPSNTQTGDNQTKTPKDDTHSSAQKSSGSGVAITQSGIHQANSFEHGNISPTEIQLATRFMVRGHSVGDDEYPVPKLQEFEKAEPVPCGNHADVRPYLKTMYEIGVERRTHRWREGETEPAVLDALSRAAPDNERQQPKRKIRRPRIAHVPLFAPDVYTQQYIDGLKRSYKFADPKPTCRCDACVGYRMHIFHRDLAHWAMARHFYECADDGSTCNMMCPTDPRSLYGAAPLTVDHLEYAQNHGWNTNAVLTGIGFDDSYRPAKYTNKDRSVIAELCCELSFYSRGFHEIEIDRMPCCPEFPCMPICFKPAKDLTSDDMRFVKKMFPQKRMRLLVTEGLAHKTIADARKKCLAKAYDHLRREKAARLASDPDLQYSQAPQEMIEWLGVFRSPHAPDCCPELPCSLFCFPDRPYPCRRELERRFEAAMSSPPPPPVGPRP